MKKLASASVGLVFAASLALPATSPAATDFGANLLAITPTGASGFISCGGSCAFWNEFLSPAATQGTVIAPSSGVIVSYSVYNSGNTSSPVHLRIAQKVNGTNWRGGAISSPDVVPSSTVGPQTFPARVPVTTGDYIALEATGVPPNVITAYAQSDAGATGSSIRRAFPLPADGSPTGTSSTANVAIALRARLEADADNDGFGDETQDCAPTDPAKQTGCVTPTTPAPKKKCKKKKKRATAVTAKKCKKKRR